jgi:hypothetical protein
VIPSVKISKVNANAGTVPASSTGIACIIAPCSGGSAITNMASSWNSPNLVQQTCLAGPLVEMATYEMGTTNLPVVLVKPTTSTPATYGSVTSTLNPASTFTPATASPTLIADDYNAVPTSTVTSPIPQGCAGVVVYFTVGGALGTLGIQYVYSLDGGNSCSAVQSLGTATTISPVEPVTGADTGVRIALGTTGQLVTQGDYFWFVTTGPRMTTSDLTSALNALFISKQPWDLLTVHGETASSFSNIVQPWIATLNATGRYTSAFLNTRFKGQVPGAVETETAYQAAMTTVVGGIVGNDLIVGADGGAYVSPLTGVTKAMPASMFALARCESTGEGVDPAEVDLGALPNCNIDNPHLTPAFHDEAVTPTLDSLRLTTLRSFFDRPGAYITNCYLMSAPGSDYVYVQNDRTMDKGCQIAFNLLTSLLSKGVPRNRKTSCILEPTAKAWEDLITSRISAALGGQVSGINFTISRTDKLTGNGPQTIHATLANDSLAYVKNFAVTAMFVSTL